MRFNVISEEAKRPFPMHVRKFVVEPSEELLSELRGLVGEDAVALAKSNGGPPEGTAA
ncbi:MAG: hypothetical protein U5K31_05305 [Balneolaceae bacterium]|nr:hypothetical protein [Balneolaceae bacterium]